MFHYALVANRNKNNVNIRIHNSSNQIIWSWNSPDDRRPATWYHIQPAVAVPPGGYATFTAIFDVSFGTDPRCTYTTAICCSTGNGWLPNGFTPSSFWGVSPPYVTRLSNNLQVQAELPGHSSFVYVVKTSGLADTYFHNQGSLFTLSQSVYGGRTVRVSARAAGPESNPWAFPELVFTVPAPPPPPPPPPCEPVPPQIICEVQGAPSIS